MPINFSHSRSLTARELTSELLRDAFVLDRQARERFEIKTLRTMIELQAHWTDADLKRLKLIA